MQPRYPPPGQYPPGQYPPGQYPPQYYAPPHGMPPTYPGMPPHPHMMHPFPAGMPPPGAFMPRPPGGIVVAPPIMRAPVIITGMATAPPVVGPPPGWTPSLTIAKSAPNPLAGAPLTLYIGKIPASIPDDVVLNLLEQCGKIQKWSRPTDASQTPKQFGFCTFEHGASAIRCRNVLGVLDLAPYVEEGEGATEPIILQVKAGSKEQASLDSMEQSEKDAADKEALAQSAAMGSADGEDERAKQVLKDLDTAVRTRVLRLLDEHAATNGRRVTPSSSSHPGDSSFGGAGGDAVDEFDDISAAPALPAGPKPTPSHSTNPFSTGIGFGVGGLGLDDDDPEREKQVLTEIEKFRLRQAQRDKEVDEQRKVRLRQRIEQLKAKQEQDKKEAVEAAKRKAVGEAAAASLIGSMRARGDDDDRDHEAKRRRKQQVLEMLAESGVAVDPNMFKGASWSADSQVIGAYLDADEPDDPKASGPIRASLKLSSNTSKGKISKAAPGVFHDEDEHKPERRLVTLDFTEEERRSAQETYKQQPEVETSDVFQKAQQHARAISAALAAAASSSTSSTAPPSTSTKGASQEDIQKQKQKQLVDQIPVAKDSLFAYRMNWEVIESQKIVDGTIKNWVVRKIIEYLGEEEATLTDFIITKLKSRCPPNELLTELAAVLDEDAETFVIKLWRMLIFSMLKASIV